MILRRIRKHSDYLKMPKDIRHHSFGISRIIYMIILITVGALIIHFLFYQYYLLVGDGFVDSEESKIELEYDAVIEDIFVENGDKVKEGDPLFYYDSMEFRTLLLKSYTDYAEVVTKRQSLNANIAHFKAAVEASEDFFKNIEKARKGLDTLGKKGLATTDRILTEGAREFTVLRDLLQFRAELASNLKALEEIDLIVDSSNSLVKNLVDKYEAGVKYASHDGIIANVTHSPGDVVKKADTIMKFYYGPKFITVLFEDSYVKKEVGDPVIVSLEGGAKTTVGWIAFMGGYATDLPDEIKPRYRPPGRRDVALVVVDDELIQSRAMLSIAKVYKPIGMNYLCRFMDCNKGKELIEKSNAFYEQKKKTSKKNLDAKRTKNKEFIKEFAK